MGYNPSHNVIPKKRDSKISKIIYTPSSCFNLLICPPSFSSVVKKESPGVQAGALTARNSPVFW
jgi:hypothetical protein